MINLMYVVLMAMLALNVSSDVLNGFKLIGERLKSSTDNSSLQNKAIYNTLSDAMKQNPEKTREWYEKAQAVKLISDSLYDYAEELKKKIAVEADGKKVIDLREKDSFFLLIGLKGKAVLETSIPHDGPTKGHRTEISEGELVLIPATATSVTVTPLEGKAELITVLQ